MKRHQLMLLLAALGLIGGTAGLLARVGTNQKLSPPAVTTRPSADPKRLEVMLPEKVLDYASEPIEVHPMTRNTLPPDTSFGQREYKGPDGFKILLSVVLMGNDRTSLHKPQFCLEGQGWHIDASGTLETHLSVDRPVSYDLPISRLIASKTVDAGGQNQLLRCVYTYWFVSDDAFSASINGADRMWMMGSKLLRTGVLQRWAYVSCFSTCAPGQEADVFERTKKFVAAAAPEFQLTPRADRQAAASDSGRKSGF